MNRATEVRLISMVIFGQLAHFFQMVPTPALNLLLPMNTPKPPPVLELTVLGFTGNHFDVFKHENFCTSWGDTLGCLLNKRYGNIRCPWTDAISTSPILH